MMQLLFNASFFFVFVFLFILYLPGWQNGEKRFTSKESKAANINYKHSKEE